MKDVYELLSGHIDRSNTDPEEAELQELLASDPEARALLDELETNDRLLKDEDIPIPAGLNSRITKAVHRHPRRSFRRKRMLPIAGAAAAVLALIVVGISTLSVPRTEDITADPYPSSSIAAIPENEVSEDSWPYHDTVCSEEYIVDGVENIGSSYGAGPLTPTVSHQKAALTGNLLKQTETETEAFLIVWTTDALSLTDQAERVETIADDVTRYILPGDCFTEATALRCPSLLYSPVAGIPSKFSLVVVAQPAASASRRLLVFSSRPGLTIPVPSELSPIPPDHAILPVQPPPTAEVQAVRPETASVRFLRLLQSVGEYGADGFMDAVVGLYGTPKAIYTLAEDQLPGLLSDGGENLQTALLMPEQIYRDEEFEVYLFETPASSDTVTE